MRAVLLEKLYEWSLIPYQSLKKNKAWDLSVNDLHRFPTGSLGQRMAHFLSRYDFDLQAKLESHDVFHVLTDTGTTVPEEISMQFYLLGNGKRSAYLFSVIILGGMLYPDYLSYFHRAYKKGNSALCFYQLDFYKLLAQPLEKIKSTFLIK